MKTLITIFFAVTVSFLFSEPAHAIFGKKGDKKYKISWSSKRGKCRKNSSGTFDSKSACKAELRNQCSSKAGWKMATLGGSCKKKKGYSIKSSKGGTKFRCKKDSSSTDDKRACKQKLRAKCSELSSQGFKFKMGTCRKKKAKLFHIVENSKKTKKRCKRLKGSAAKGKTADDVSIFSSKRTCKQKLKAACTGTGYKFSMGSCRKAKAKLFHIVENSKKTKKRCRRIKGSAAQGKTADDVSIFSSKRTCKQKLKAACTGTGYKFSMGSCRKAKVRLFEIKKSSNGKKAACRKYRGTAKEADKANGIYSDKRACRAALPNYCLTNSGTMRGKSCRFTSGGGTGGNVTGLISDNLNGSTVSSGLGGAQQLGLMNNNSSSGKVGMNQGGKEAAKDYRDNLPKYGECVIVESFTNGKCKMKKVMCNQLPSNEKVYSVVIRGGKILTIEDTGEDQLKSNITVGQVIRAQKVNDIRQNPVLHRCGTRDCSVKLEMVRLLLKKDEVKLRACGSNLSGMKWRPN